MGCCGGAAQSVPRKTMPTAQAQITGDRVPVAYVGARQGDFWITGPVSRVRYHITGRGDFLTDDVGRVGVDRRDVRALTSMNRGRNFKVIQPPAPAPPRPVRQATPEKSEAWKPTAMEEQRIIVDMGEASLPDIPHPGDLTLKQLRALKGLTVKDAAWMLEEELGDKNRVGAIRFLEMIASET